ncbi:hypothetical protein AB0G15_22830 [Streptosporangium sp. NPDC023825]|uniref:hypothetical protein n=1 Tax=Streptosporangium sp. NPDC023825 TaxID=3154909 RepID=UPI003420F293
MGAIGGPVLDGATLSAGLPSQVNFYLFALPALVGATLIWVAPHRAPEVGETG